MKRLAILACCILYSIAGLSKITTRPAGDIRGPFVFKSRIYPGTERNYWLYIPKQYDASKPTCSMILQDGISCANGWNLPAVLDSLIDAKAIPVVIGIFIDHGKVAAGSGNDNYPRYNRSFEYDAMGDRYARFLLEELLPEVARSYNLSNDPNDRSIAGASSGAICAFNAAWERPDAFHRVFSSIGTYVGLRGADGFATLVRKSEPKPLRVFLQDGNQDLNIYGGDWWMANQSMLSALTWSGYEVNHAWGDGGHNSRHTVTIIGQALVWLWKDYPAPVKAHNGNMRRLNIVPEGESWQEINLNGIYANKLAVNANGQLFFSGVSSVYTVDESGNTKTYIKLPTTSTLNAIAFDGKGTLYASDTRQHKIITVDSKGSTKDIVTGVNASYMIVTGKGIYFSDRLKGNLWFYNFASKQLTSSILNGHPSNGIAISAEQTFMNAGSDEVFGYSFLIKQDGNLDNGQQYIHYHIPYGLTGPATGGMTVDTANLLYTTTAMGIQVSDQLGRVNYIISKPGDSLQDVKLAGEGLNLLYVTSNGKLFRRRLNTKGVLPFLPPVKPSRPGL